MGNTSFTDRSLTIEIHSDSTVQVSWRGRSTARDPEQFILPILTQALDTAGAEDKPLVLDFRHLEYMNSSTVTPLIRVLGEARKRNLQLTVLYDKKLNWQALNFSALEVFHTEDNRIEIRGL